MTPYKVAHECKDCKYKGYLSLKGSEILFKCERCKSSNVEQIEFPEKFPKIERSSWRMWAGIIFGLFVYNVVKQSVNISSGIMAWSLSVIFPAAFVLLINWIVPQKTGRPIGEDRIKLKNHG